MQVSKPGNSLAVRDRSKERAIEQLRQMKWSFPPDFKFNREEVNER
jgi:hypothetical protein